MEAVEEALRRIEDRDGAVGAVVASDAEAALRDARLIDALPSTERGPLAGVPFLVKDVEDAVGYRTTYGSLQHVDDPPATCDAPTVARLKAAGAVVVGKSNTPEHAHSAGTDNRVFGPTRNPWSPAVGVGGSSGGSAAAVAAGMVPLATGSDGGGSLRIPAAACGLPAFKPTLGLVPHGDRMAPDWPELSTRGVLTPDLAGMLTAYDVVVGPHPLDLRSVPAVGSPWVASVSPALPPVVAWSPTLGYAQVDREVEALCWAATAAIAAEMAARVVEMDHVFDADPITTWLWLVSHRLRHAVDPVRAELLDPGLQRIIETFGSPQRGEVAAAMDACHDLNRQAHERVFGTVDLLFCPTTGGTPDAYDGSFGTIDGSRERAWVGLTYPWNLTRQPAATVPVGLTVSGLPVGLQIVGRRHDDLLVLRALAAAIEVLPALPILEPSS